MIRTVADLIRELEDLNDPDAPVFIAGGGPRTFHAYRISAVVEGEASGEDRFGVYLGEGAQLAYLPADVANQI